MPNDLLPPDDPHLSAVQQSEGDRMKLRLKRGVERKLVWSKPDSKIAPFCSVCLAHIPDDDVPLMIWNEEGSCAQFCEACAQKYIETDGSELPQ